MSYGLGVGVGQGVLERDTQPAWMHSNLSQTLLTVLVEPFNIR